MSESKKDRLTRLARSDQFISGIYNYCDRWCERCTLRNKCLSFAMDPGLGIQDSPGNDPRNEAFWEGIHENFALAFDLLQESAAKWGIDLSVAPDPEAEERERQREREEENDPLLKNAMAYADAVDAWMDERNGLFGENARQTEREIEMELPGHNPLPDVIDLHEAVEVIRWYQFFLYPKIARAMSGLLDDERDMMDDVFGSAKIALVALERSIGAWQTLGRLLQQSDEVLELQIQLTQIKAELERRIPAARDFKRPGFDE